MINNDAQARKEDIYHISFENHVVSMCLIILKSDADNHKGTLCSTQVLGKRAIKLLVGWTQISVITTINSWLEDRVYL